MKKRITIRNKSVQLLLWQIVDSAEQVKGDNIVILDFSDIENVSFDFFVICEGHSSVQTKAISRAVSKGVRSTIRKHPLNIEGEDNAEWILLDYGYAIVHVFQKHIRSYYNIEDLWGDAIRIDPNSLVSNPS